MDIINGSLIWNEMTQRAKNRSEYLLFSLKMYACLLIAFQQTANNDQKSVFLHM